MLIELPVIWLILANIFGWLALHLLIAWAGTRLTAELFDARGFVYRLRPWESDGRLYERLFRIKAWKDILPDGASWFQGGFPKAALQSRDPGYVSQFIKETCRGEAVHWLVMLIAPVFFLWNPPWAGATMLVYGVLANLPCIIIQRYNRSRLLRLHNRASSRKKARG